MRSSLLHLVLLPLLLAYQATANSAATCITPISGQFSAHPQCAQSCLGCLDSNESFAHACELDNTCCQGTTASLYIPRVYGCVKTTCSESEAQKSWEVFTNNCRRKGYPVAEVDTPSGYLVVSSGGSDGLTTATTGTSATVPGRTTLSTGTSGAHTGTATTSSPTDTPSTTQNPASNDNGSSSSSKGLGTGEIVGIALGAVSALAAVIGLGLRWKHLQLAKKNGAVNDAEAKI